VAILGVGERNAGHRCRAATSDAFWWSFGNITLAGSMELMADPASMRPANRRRRRGGRPTGAGGWRWAASPRPASSWAEVAMLLEERLVRLTRIFRIQSV